MEKLENELEQLFNAVPCGILKIEMPISDVCHICRINQTAVRILKLTEEQLEENTLCVADYLDETNRRTAFTVLSHLKNPGDQGTFLLQLYQGTVQGEAKLIAHDDRIFLQLIFMEIGNEIAIRRREAEQAELLDSVLQSVRCGVIRFGFAHDEEKIILANRMGWQMLGFETEDACKAGGINAILPKVHPEDRKVLLRVHCTLREHNGRNGGEFRIYGSGHVLRWISMEEQMLRDAHGNDIIQMTMTDITEQKIRMEEKDAQNGEIIQSLGTMYFMIAYIDVKNDRYRLIKNDMQQQEKEKEYSYTKELKEKSEQMKFQPVTESKSESDVSLDCYELLCLEQMKKRYAAGASLWECDFQFGSDQNVRYYRIETVMSGIEEKLQHIVMGIRDVTGLRRQELLEQDALKSAYEAAFQANRAKTDFLSRMSHDIRTPMNAIVGLSQIMKKHITEPDVLLNYLGKIDDSSQILLELINDVLDMTRVESGKLELEEQSFDLNKFVEKIQTVIVPSMQKHQHQFTIENHLSAGLVRGDMLRIQQIILNILSNCVKFTPDRGTISWKLWQEASGCGKYQNIHFLITDNGIGMTKEFLERIYQPFEREERAALKQIQGTGLGMTIVCNLVQLMNGRIEIESEPGKGSSFHIILPLEAEKSETATAAAPFRKSMEKPNLQGRRILLVEDNAINMLIASELLKDTGAEIAQAENGQVGLETFLSHGPGYFDLIFMDIRMPVMGGYEATRKIRSSGHMDADRIPIIAMTANAFTEDVQKALDAGMNEHLAKPVQVDLLYQVLQKWLCREQ